MKMKKTILLFSMIAVFFSLTACSSGQKEVTFNYTQSDIVSSALTQAYQLQSANGALKAYLEDYAEESEEAEILLTGLNNFTTVQEECGDFLGYCSREDGNTIQFDFSTLNAETEDEYVEAMTAYNEFLSRVDAVVEEEEDTVVVTIGAVYSDRKVDYSFVYEENPAAAYSYELTGQNATAYKIKEINVTPEYTFSEKMKKAGSNTLVGMGTVFVVLIFISLIIAQLEKVAKAITGVANAIGRKKGNQEEETAAVAAVSNSGAAPAAVSTASPMDDKQLVAVITAAVMAANVADGGSDKLVVRSIRKAKR